MYRPIRHGRLSRPDLEQLQAGARVDVVDVKQRSPMDFVLWKNVEEGRAELCVAVGRGRRAQHVNVRR